jgi:hypothetical protein
MSPADNSSEVAVTIGANPLHPRHGVHAPRARLRVPTPGAVRRTLTIDTIRPGDLRGDAVQIGRARDVRVGAAGHLAVLDEASVTTTLAYADHYRLVAIDSDPGRAALQQLVGTSVSTGFRAAVAEFVPEDLEQATLLHALLDDLPGAALVSGYALGAAGVQHERKPGAPRLQIEGLCAGFQKGGTIMVAVDSGGSPPVVTGPLAPSLVHDVGEWHALRDMGAHDMRRWRCLDVVPGASPDDDVQVEAYFRDSHVDPAGVETVIHEYTVTAVVDPRSATVVASSAVAHSLPWLECIEAEASGDRIAGRALRGLRKSVREEFVGVTTCTHLNDTLRSIDDVRALLAVLPGRG